MVTLFAGAGDAGASNGAFNLPAVVEAAFLAVPEVYWGFIFLCVAHGGLLVAWLLSGVWRDAHPLREIKRPYYRIVVLHVTLLVAGMPVMILGEPAVGVFILALIKTSFEIFSAANKHFPVFDEGEAEAPGKALEALWEKRRG